MRACYVTARSWEPWCHHLVTSPLTILSIGVTSLPSPPPTCCIPLPFLPQLLPPTPPSVGRPRAPQPPRRCFANFTGYLSPSGSGPRPFTRTPFPNNVFMIKYAKKLNFHFIGFLSCAFQCFLSCAFQCLSVFQLEGARCQWLVIAFSKNERQADGFQCSGIKD